MTKKFLFAGLDFMFDTVERPYFIEANSAPGGTIEAAEVLKHHPLKAIAQLLTGKNPCIIFPKKSLHDPVYEELQKYIPNLKFCYSKDNTKRKKYFQDIDKNKFEPTCIFRGGNLICTSFSKKIPVINPKSVSKITVNKSLTYKIVKNIKGVNIPRYDIVRNKKEFNKVKDEFNDFVLKPLYGSHGIDVCVNKVSKITRPMMIQERIFPKKIKNKFWDVRVYVINGKYAGGIIRMNKNPVTNLSRGGKACALPKRFEKKIKHISEKITKAIDKAASK